MSKGHKSLSEEGITDSSREDDMNLKKKKKPKNS
jgi:hypothetical protein